MTQTDQLSEREKEVVELLLLGKSNKQIALALGISERTVEFHLKNVYGKLQVSSRTEAVLKLGKTPGAEPVESAVTVMENNVENDGKPILRRIPMKNILYIAGAGLLTTVLLIVFVLVNVPAKGAEILPTATVNATDVLSTVTPTAMPTLTPQPTISPKAHISEQIRRVVAEYEQNVQAEKRNGKVEFSKDPKTGKEIFLFKDESYARIFDLNQQMWEKINQLNQLYTQVYRDELKPTPYPTQATAEQNRAYYETLLSQGQDYCPWDFADKGLATLSVYSPDDGKDLPIMSGDALARCEVWGQMVDEFRYAPSLAKVNKDADISTIRQVTGKPGLVLTFQTITSIANAMGRDAALYKDKTGTKYYVDVETARLAQIEPNFPTHPDIAASETKSLDELRGIANQFALTNSPRLAELKSVLIYEENGKVDISFFTWSYRNNDWSGTDWVMMPPFIQVGVLSNGQIATYINTLDLFK